MSKERKPYKLRNRGPEGKCLDSLVLHYTSHVHLSILQLPFTAVVVVSYNGHPRPREIRQFIASISCIL
jgi:hypothetical protein